MKWKCTGSHWKWTLMYWGTATLWMHTMSGGTILHFILLYRLNVIWEVHRIVKVKIENQEDTASACHRLRERSCHLQGLLSQLPITQFIKITCYSNGPWSTKMSPGHFALSRVLLIYSHSPSFLPIPGKYTKHCKLVTVLSPFSLNSLNYLLPPMNTGARKTAAFKTAFLIKRWFKSFCLSLIQGSCSWQQSPRINLQNHKNIMFASALDITFAIFLSKYIILV